MPKPRVDRFTVPAGENVGVVTGDEPDRRGAGRIIVVATAHGSGRSAVERRRRREGIRRLFGIGARALDLPLEDLCPADEGPDGLRLVVAPEVMSPADLLEVFLVTVAEALRERAASETGAERLRLRIAVHFGFPDDQAGDRDGWAPNGDGTRSGGPLAYAARLAGAAEVRRRLQGEEDACLALVVSGDLHREIVGHGYAHAGPGGYDRFGMTADEASSHAWVRLI
jgi:hypothetical protein